MEEETLFGERYGAARSPLDEALIGKYCSGIEERLRQAGSRREAVLILEDACRDFERQCESEIIPLFLQRYVTNLFEQLWGASK